MTLSIVTSKYVRIPLKIDDVWRGDGFALHNKTTYMIDFTQKVGTCNRKEV